MTLTLVFAVQQHRTVMSMTPSRKDLYSKKLAEPLMGLVTCSSPVFLIQGKYKNPYFKLMKPVMVENML